MRGADPRAGLSGGWGVEVVRSGEHSSGREGGGVTSRHASGVTAAHEARTIWRITKRVRLSLGSCIQARYLQAGEASRKIGEL